MWPRPGSCRPISRRFCPKPAQHIGQDSAMAEILDLVERIDPANGVEALVAAIGPLEGDADIHAGRYPAGETTDREHLFAGERQGLAIHALLELKRQHTHADEVGAVDTLEAFRQRGADTQKLRSLGRPVAR